MILSIEQNYSSKVHVNTCILQRFIAITQKHQYFLLYLYDAKLHTVHHQAKRLDSSIVFELTTYLLLITGMLWYHQIILCHSNRISAT